MRRAHRGATRRGWPHRRVGCQLRHARVEDPVGVEAGVEEERRGEAEGPQEARFERFVSVIVHEVDAA